MNGPGGQPQAKQNGQHDYPRSRSEIKAVDLPVADLFARDKIIDKDKYVEFGGERLGARAEFVGTE